MSLAVAIQGYFPQGVPRHLIQSRPAAIRPRTVNGADRRPPSYGELTVRAHQRSSGLTTQSAADGKAILLSQYLTGFDRRPGQKLPPAVQQKMNSFFKTNFSDVEVHVGPEASSIGALAFTKGSEIFFAPGQYNPLLPQGQQLLAHELAHVVQQRAGRVRSPFSSGVAIVVDPALEAEAQRMGARVAMCEPAATATIGAVKSRPARSSRIQCRWQKPFLQKSSESPTFPPPEDRQSLETDTATLNETLEELDRVILAMPETAKNAINKGKAPIHFTCSIEKKSIGNMVSRCKQQAAYRGSQVTQDLAWYDPEGAQGYLNMYGPHITICTSGKETDSGKSPDVYHHIFFKFGETKDYKK